MLAEILKDLINSEYIALDTETTGLFPFKGDRIIGISLSTRSNDYYINFKNYDDDSEIYVKEDVYEVLNNVFLDTSKKWFMFNAKFDLHMLSMDGAYILGEIHDCYMVERLLNNLLMPGERSLDATAKRYGLEKSTAVVDYLEEHGHFEHIIKPGKKVKKKNYFFEKVPYQIISEYAKQDSRITYQIGMNQLIRLREIAEQQKNIPNTLQNVFENEKKLTKTVFHMEHHGFKIDLKYCNEALSYYEDEYGQVRKYLSEVANAEYVDSADFIKKHFSDIVTHKKSKKTGNMSFDNEALEEISSQNEVVGKIIELRKFKKYLDYFNNFINFSDDNGILHAEFDQAGTKTGRFSSKDPNLQNLTKSDLDEPFPVRRAIIPRPGYFFAMLDYDQQEYRMMLDYAGAIKLIRRIVGGLDVHEATAKLAQEISMDITRSQAKTVNFSILYGSGIDTLANKLGTTPEKAREIKEAVLRAAPEIITFINKCKDRSRINGHVRTWLGRILQFPLGVDGTDYSYKAPNAIIQGGCADTVKVAMNHIDAYLSNKSTRLVGTIHDECILEVKENERRIVRDIKDIMENAYPHKSIRLTCSADYSYKSLADKMKFEF